jgi:periplasmic protein TonB
MNNLEKKEERNKRIGWITSVAVQLGLLVLFYFLIAWKAPFPPIPEYGIELGFATSAGATSSTPPPEVTEEQVTEEEIQEEEQQPIEEVVETEEVVQPEMESMEEEIVANEIETPVKVEKAVTKPTETKPVEKPKEKIEEKKVEAKPKENLTEKIDSGEGQAEKAEEPVVDQRAIYGSQGTSEGNNEGESLSLAGWEWDFKPKPDDTSAETGKIVYKIVVDDEGLLIDIKSIFSNVSPEVERKYRQAVEKLTFSKTADNKTAPQSTGSITFIIKAK